MLAAYQSVQRTWLSGAHGKHWTVFRAMVGRRLRGTKRRASDRGMKKVKGPAQAELGLIG